MNTDNSMKMYALVDACNTPDFLEMLKTYDPPASCLYNEPLQEGMAERAPYIVELTSEPVKAWLANLTTPWGLYLITDKANFLEMRKHLRRYTFAMVPISEKPVFFRFYDPRTIWNIIDIMDDWQLHAFLGPIDIVATYFDGQYCQEHFDERRKQFPNQIRMKTQYITWSEEQFARLNKIHENKYVRELAEHMMQYVDLSSIGQAKNNADQQHREMLKHERDVKGADIDHPADQEFLITENGKAQSIQNEDEAYFHYSNQTMQWSKVQNNIATPVTNYLITVALHKLARNSISESEFHQLTNFEYEKFANLAPEKTPTKYDNGWDHQPYFYHQQNTWFYVDVEGFAHPIQDERITVLNRLNQEKIFENAFHQITRGQYHQYLGLAYLPEEKDEDDELEINSMEDLEKVIYQFARDFVEFGSQYEINDDRSYKSLGEILIRINIFRMKDFPQEWKNILMDLERNGMNKSKSVFLQALKVWKERGE